MPETENKSEFHIGLTMSGAISAGAYTAGVFDFLIQALDEWEKARHGELDGVDPGAIPNHRVGLKVMSGASAGALTAAIGTVALADAGQQPLFFDDQKTKIKCYLPKLYEVWVVKPTLDASATKDANDFLTTTDLRKRRPGEPDFSRTAAAAPPQGPAPDGASSNSAADIGEHAATMAAAPLEETTQTLSSVLNSRLLDEIAHSALEVRAVRPPRDYISETLHIYLTLTNLRGVPYRVSFEGGDYHMVTHGDRVHYAVTGVGRWKTQSAFADNDRKREIDACWLQDGHSSKPYWNDFTVCALASAAFPVGLAPRLVVAGPDEYAGLKAGETIFRRFPDDDLVGCGDIGPSWPDDFSDFPFMTADGGTIDNDPFEYARFALKKQGALGGGIEWRLREADRAVIMVSPFPEGKTMQPTGKPARDILSIFSALLPSLIDQARFKPSELVLAADPLHGSRYLVAPKRYDRPDKQALYPIASGLLGGFGGFVSRAFRDHDFQLGRRNCQKFLEATFALPAKNERFLEWPAAAFSKEFESTDQTGYDPANGKFYRLIPLFGAARDVVEPPDWPRISKKELDCLQTRIAQRFDAVAPVFLAENVKGLLKILLAIALVRPRIPGLIRARALDFAGAAVLSDLVRRDQIEGFEILPNGAGLDGDTVRMILAAMIGPDMSTRSVPDIAAAIGQTDPKFEGKIAAVLEEFTTAKSAPYETWKAPWTDDEGRILYALADRKPPLLQRLWRPIRGAIRQLRRR